MAIYSGKPVASSVSDVGYLQVRLVQLLLCDDWHTLLITAAAAGIVTGAFGAHGLKSRIPEAEKLHAWGTASHFAVKSGVLARPCLLLIDWLPIDLQWSCIAGHLAASPILPASFCRSRNLCWDTGILRQYLDSHA